MRKLDALFELWYYKLEMMSYAIGDANGAFDAGDMRDFEVLETLVYMSAKSKIATGPAQELLALFRLCDPTQQYVTDDGRRAYKKMLRRMNKLAEFIGEDPVVPPSSDEIYDD